VGEVFASLAINHIIDRETLNQFSKWYQDTALEELTGITPDKLNSTNLGAVMKTCGKIGPEGIVDVCIELFNKIKHLDSLKSKRRLLKSWGLRMHSFRVVAYTTLKVRL